MPPTQTLLILLRSQAPKKYKEKNPSELWHWMIFIFPRQARSFDYLLQWWMITESGIRSRWRKHKTPSRLWFAVNRCSAERLGFENTHLTSKSLHIIHCVTFSFLPSKHWFEDLQINICLDVEIRDAKFGWKVTVFQTSRSHITVVSTSLFPDLWITNHISYFFHWFK